MSIFDTTRVSLVSKYIIIDIQVYKLFTSYLQVIYELFTSYLRVIARYTI
jgi:hypothetical protein